MGKKSTIRNATDYHPTDWQPNNLEESTADLDKLRRFLEEDSLLAKISSHGVPPSSKFPSRSGERSELPRSLESPTIASLIPEEPERKAKFQRLGNVMSHKQHSSSPATSSASVKSPNSRGSSSGNGDEPHVIIQKQPPKYVYSNESFEVTLQLSNSKAGSPSESLFRDREIELVASLHNDNNNRECGPEALLITQPPRISMSPGDDGVHRCSIVCMIRMDSIRREQGAALSVKFQPRPEASPPIRGLSGVRTNPIHLVNYKIKLTLEDDWGPVWYKDEGGRDKSMEIYAAIYDKDGQIRTGEQIPLHPTLCYDVPGDVPAPCANQEILRTLGTSKVIVDKDTGRARIRFRVEDVSKNHQAQDFVLQVGTDPKAKGFRDVAPDYTPAVNVRSKRNKRSRNPTATSRAFSDQSRRSSPAVRSRGYEEQGESSVFEPADVPRLRDALKSVINWADEVVNGLFPLQWQVLGYAQHPDGSTDYSRPYHNMPNPNPCISRVLGMYSDTVRDSLRLLLDSVEQANPRSDSDATSMMPVPIAAPQPRPGVDDSMYGGMMRPHHLPGPIGGHPSMSAQGLARRQMLPHSGGPPDAFSPGGPQQDPMYAGRAGVAAATPPHMLGPHGHSAMPPLHTYMRPEGNDFMPIHMGMPPPRGDMPPMGGADLPMQRSMRSPEEESREAEVKYVLAKQYKALRTGERLGFPAYSGNKEILGFYREQAGGGGTRQFSPISRHRNDFGPLEILQATEILEDAIKKKSEAVHALKDWGSIDNLLNQALVYDWRQDISNDQGPTS